MFIIWEPRKHCLGGTIETAEAMPLGWIIWDYEPPVTSRPSREACLDNQPVLRVLREGCGFTVSASVLTGTSPHQSSLPSSSVSDAGDSPEGMGKPSQRPLTPSYGSPTVFPDWGTLNSFIREGMVLPSLLCVGSSQDRWVPTAGNIDDVCPNKAEWRKVLFRLKWKMLENIQVGKSMRRV